MFWPPLPLFIYFSLLGPIIGDFVESAEAQLLQQNPHMENIHKQGGLDRPLNCGRLSQRVLVKSSIMQHKKAGRHQSRVSNLSTDYIPWECIVHASLLKRLLTIYN